MSAPPAPILVVGVPRSSTTWLATLLAAAAATDPVNEPDNHHHQLHAAPAKVGLGSFPVLAAGDAAGPFERLWQRVFAGSWPRNDDPQIVSAATGVAGLRVPALDAMLFDPADRREALDELAEATGAWVPPGAPRPPVVVKTVQMSLALEWFHDRFPGIAIVVVERHPLDVVASWKSQFDSDLGPIDPRFRSLPGLAAAPDPPAEEAPLTTRIAWRVGVLTSAQRNASERLGCTVLHHEELCADVDELVSALAWRLGLPYPAAAAAKAAETDRPGSGYEINRVRAGLANTARDRLSADERAAAGRMLAGFPLNL